MDTIQSIKQYLLIHNQNAVEKFVRNDPLRDPVPKELVKKMEGAYMKRQENVEKQKQRKTAFLSTLAITPRKSIARSMFRRIAIEAAEKSQKKAYIESKL